MHFSMMRRADWVLLEERTERLVDDGLHRARDIGVAELALGLTSNCGSASLTETMAVSPSRTSSPRASRRP